MLRLFGLRQPSTQCATWFVLGTMVAACGATTEPLQHDSVRRVLPRDHSTGSHGPAKADEANGAETPGGTPGAGNVGEEGAPDDDDPSPDQTGQAGDDSGEPEPVDPSATTGGDDAAADPDDPMGGEMPEGNEDDEVPMQAICATEPLWVSGEIAVATDTTTLTSWLVPAIDSSAIGWTILTEPPTSQRLQFGTGNIQPPAETQTDGNCEAFAPPWPELVSTHAISAEMVSRVLGCPADSVVPEGALNGGAIALTPDASRLLKVRCAGDHSELEVFTLGTTNERTATFALSGQGCPTRMLATNEFALVADNVPSLRYVDLADGSELFNLMLPGPAGQIDATENADRVLLSTLRGDLVDLQPGRFIADALVVSVPVAELRDATGQHAVSSRLSFVNGGSLVSAPEFEPGYIQLPGALHPSGSLTATFGPDEDLIVLDTETSDAIVLEPSSIPDELLAEEPRRTGLPTALEFSADGQFLARVRGGQLAVFACTQRPRQ